MSNLPVRNIYASNTPVGNIYLGRRFTVEEQAATQVGEESFVTMLVEARKAHDAKPPRETREEYYARVFAAHGCSEDHSTFLKYGGQCGTCKCEWLIELSVTPSSDRTG